MGDLLLALLVFTVLVALGLTLLAGLTIVPFVAALHLAEVRGLSSARVSAGAAGGVLLGFALAGAVLLLDAPRLLVVPALLLVWAVPLGLRLLSAPALAGRAGRHA